VPAANLDELQMHYRRSVAASTRRVHQLKRVLSLFREREIEVVVLKGAYLAEAVYDDVALRNMSDVDLLVREKDIERAKEALLGSGFRQWAPAAMETRFPHSHHLVPFVGDGEGSITIELHRRLMESSIDAADYWSRTRATRVADVEVLALCPEDLILHVSLHACIHHHLKGGVIALLDMDAILDALADEIDWESLAARARLWKAGRCVALMLTYLADFFGAQVPEGAVAGLAPGGIAPEVIGLADLQIFGPVAVRPDVSITLTRLFHAGGPRAFVAVLLERFYPSKAELLVRYRAASPGWLPFIYVIHPFILIRIHGGAALRLFVGMDGERAKDEESRQGLALASALMGAPLRCDDIVRNGQLG
jgi:hypothetical protein